MRETITGRNPVYESLRAKRRDVFRLLIAEGVQERGRLTEILDMAALRKIPVERVPRPRLDKLSDSHQGVALEVSGYPYIGLDDILENASGRREALFVLILDTLQKTYPYAVCALHHKSAWQLLIATILSAQCTDVRVNLVTPALFKTFPTPKAMAAASLPELEEMVRTTGFFRNKAKSLQGAGRIITEEFGGKVPKTMPELLRIPGVARKTANVVLGTCFHIADGIVVDTHVLRIARRLALTRETTPEKVERDLMRLIPQSQLDVFADYCRGMDARLQLRRGIEPADGARACGARLRRPDHGSIARTGPFQGHDEAPRRRAFRLLHGLPAPDERQLRCPRGL